MSLCHRKFGDLRTTLFAVLYLLAACSWRAATLLLIYTLAPHIVAQVKSPLHLLWVSGHNLRDTLILSARLKEESGCVTFFLLFSYIFGLEPKTVSKTPVYIAFKINCDICLGYTDV